MDLGWAVSVLQTFREGGPWMLVGGAVATVTWIGNFARLLRSGDLHFKEQCLETRTLLKDRVLEERADRLETKADLKHAHALLAQGSGTILQGARTVERLVEATVPKATPADERPPP
jgi:hypothetical protein